MPVATEHTCSICGQFFTWFGNASKCTDCRAPRGAKRFSNELSPRERQVVVLVAEAKANKEIAYTLKLTEGTVKVYLSRIFVKTGSANRVDLALRSVAGSI